MRAKEQAKANTKKKRAATARKWAKDHPLEMAGFLVKHRYGLTTEQQNAMLDEQGWHCAVCHTAPERSPKQYVAGRKYQPSATLVVDHDAGTKKVRAYLCQHCNKGLGFFRHDPALLFDAAQYLMTHGK